MVLHRRTGLIAGVGAVLVGGFYAYGGALTPLSLNLSMQFGLLGSFTVGERIVLGSVLLIPLAVGLHKIRTQRRHRR